MNTKVKELAAKFSELLLAEIGERGLAEAVRLNATPAYAGCCASHDFCDANVVMAYAFTVCGFSDDPAVPSNAAMHTLWDAAWDMAKAAGFDAGKLGARK